MNTPQQEDDPTDDTSEEERNMKAPDERAIPGRPGLLDNQATAKKGGILGCPKQPEAKPLAEWTDNEIEVALLEIGGLFAARLALRTVGMTEPDLQGHEQQLNSLFDLRETLHIEQIRRDAERLRQAALAECLAFSMSTNGESG